MAQTSKNLLEKARRALMSRAIPVPSIKQRTKIIKSAQKTARKNEILSALTATPMFAAMMIHCAKRKARQRARKKT